MQHWRTKILTTYAEISIHAPYKGCNDDGLKKTTKSMEFQSMHPIKDATKLWTSTALNKQISIHAPYKGCNLLLRYTLWTTHQFQSMHPIKDATDITDYVAFGRKISIHAPYKGCNSDLYLNLSISNENRLKLLLFLRK